MLGSQRSRENGTTIKHRVVDVRSSRSACAANAEQPAEYGAGVFPMLSHNHQIDKRTCNFFEIPVESALGIQSLIGSACLSTATTLFARLDKSRYELALVLPEFGDDKMAQQHAARNSMRCTQNRWSLV